MKVGIEETDLGLIYVESKNLLANIDENIQQENGHMHLKHICENCAGDLYVCWSFSDRYYWYEGKKMLKVFEAYICTKQ